MEGAWVLSAAVTLPPAVGDTNEAGILQLPFQMVGSFLGLLCWCRLPGNAFEMLRSWVTVDLRAWGGMCALSSLSW